ncbi:MAG: zinc-binding dehydrogenase [bacterium]
MAELMRAVVKSKPDIGAEMREVPIPQPAPDEVLIRVRATSICGTDVHIYKWDAWSQKRIGEKNLPHIMGHEMCGEVVAVGREVKRIKVGDYVSVETHIPNPSDLQFWVGQMHIGDHMKIVGVDRAGSFADYLAVPEIVCWRNDPYIPPEYASIQEPLGNATYCLLGEDGDVAGLTMVILGDGPIGLMATALARAVGVAKIFVVGLSPTLLEIARQLGADFILNANDPSIDRVEFVKDQTGGAGADIVLEMAGASDAIQEGFRMLRKGGRLSAFGVISQEHIPLDYNDSLVFKGARVYGINGRKMFDTWYRVRNLLTGGRLNLEPIVGSLISLEDYEQGFGHMLANPRTVAKVVMFPEEHELLQALNRRENKLTIEAQ